MVMSHPKPHIVSRALTSEPAEKIMSIKTAGHWAWPQRT